MKDLWAGKGMTQQRYRQLNDATNRDGEVESSLTEEEYKAGWHFCWSEWDGLLIHKDDPEMEACSCNIK